MMTRREAIGVLGSMSAGAVCVSTGKGLGALISPWSRAASRQDDASPTLAPGAPMSPERMALINEFKEKSAGIEKTFEARIHKSDWAMPYRVFRPAATGKLPLVLFLHGSGGLGDDNEKQMGVGNIYGTRVWALPENQKKFPCFVVAPQTDRGWVRYGPPSPGDSIARVIAGLGDGARLALEIVDALCRELAVDERRIYVTGQSMGGSGVWHMTAHRPRFFAAAIPCCGGETTEPPAASIGTPVWNFHGDADQTVPVSRSRERIAVLRKSGGHPVYTEYAGVDHNVWQWAYTEPALLRWVFAKRRPA